MTDDIQALARQITEIWPLIMRTVNARMRQTDHLIMHSHLRVLWYLEHHSATLSQIAEHQLVSLPTMSNSITILEERGWVTRTRSSEDRRKVMIEITPAGREVLAQVRHFTEARIVEIIQSVSAEDRERVSQGLAILREAFIAANPTIDACMHKTK